MRILSKGFGPNKKSGVLEIAGVPEAEGSAQRVGRADLPLQERPAYPGDPEGAKRLAQGPVGSGFGVLLLKLFFWRGFRRF